MSNGDRHRGARGLDGVSDTSEANEASEPWLGTDPGGAALASKDAALNGDGDRPPLAVIKGPSNTLLPSGPNARI